MKRIALITALILVAGAALWSGLWFAGRGSLEARLDLEADRLAQAGIAITWEGAETGGYPAGYELALSGIDIETTEFAARLPRLDIAIGAEDPDSLAVVFPRSFTLRVKGETERLFEIEADALTATVSEAGGNPAVDLAAISVLAVHKPVQDASEASATVIPGLEGLAGELVSLKGRLMTEGPEARLSLSAERLETVITGEGQRGPAEDRFRYTIDAIAERPLLTGRVTLSGRPLVGALAAGLSGLPVRATLQTGPTETVLATAPSEGAAAVSSDGRLVLAHGSVATLVEIEPGHLDAASTFEALRLTLDPASETARLRGPIAINRLDLAYAAPTDPDAGMGPLRLRLAAAEIAPDPALWDALDPEAALDHAPMELVLELTGTMRLAGPDAPLPAEIGTLEIVNAHLGALGASLDATGAVEFLQPQMLPIGAVELRLFETMPMLRDLVVAGLLQPEAAETAMLLAANYTEAGERPEELT
ncbi:MAG: DUF2125 domain-containing protein, partial [Pseudomonadota bacterium]